MEIKLTQFSHGSGCGCKIAPDVLQEIIKSTQETGVFKNLMVGNATKDDAAVWELDDENVVISTTDFFMPIVDDAFQFGKIAATNAISDIYAMGGEPIMAIAILGFPIDKIPVEIAQQIIEGGRNACATANIPLAGGHTIDSPEPFFGLAVTGRAKKNEIKQNSGAKLGDVLFLTKPLGVGLLTTAQKSGVLQPNELDAAIEVMSKLNSIGQELGKMDCVNAMTDVTGFGLIGHLLEVCEGSNLSAEIIYNSVPIIDAAKNYAYSFMAPKGFTTNWNTYKDSVSETTETQRVILADPQTSGGLLISVDEKNAHHVQKLLELNGLYSQPIGKMIQSESKSKIFIK